MSRVPQTTQITKTQRETEPVLEAEHLEKVFPLSQLNPFAQKRGVYAVEDASLALYSGRVTALVGESGSGKTTIARMLARVYDPTAGTIRFAEGEGLQPLPARRGEILSLISPPSGCRFHPRCPQVMKVCRQRFPKRTELGGGHWTNCFLYGDGGIEREHHHA